LADLHGTGFLPSGSGFAPWPSALVYRCAVLSAATLCEEPPSGTTRLTANVRPDGTFDLRVQVRSPLTIHNPYPTTTSVDCRVDPVCLLRVF